MEGRMFDNVKFEKEKAIARFNRLRRVVKLRQLFEVLVVFGLISWSSTRVPAILKVTGEYFVEVSTYLFNHHVVFLIGNAIIALLFTLCRQNDVNLPGGEDFYDDYVKYSEAAHQRDSSTLCPPANPEVAPAAESGGRDEEKRIVTRTQCDDVAAAIEKATRQIKRFQRTQSEKLKQEIAVQPRPELRRSETGNYRKTSDSAEIENLSNEEFRRRVDAFIDEHWIKRKTKDYENYQLLKMA